MAVEEYSLVKVSMAAGIFWAVWTVKGFWWGVLASLFWPAWLGYHVAVYLLK